MLRSPLTDAEISHHHLCTSSLVLRQHVFLSRCLTNGILMWDTCPFLTGLKLGPTEGAAVCAGCNLCPCLPGPCGIWHSWSLITENQTSWNVCLASKHMKKSLLSLVIREMQMKKAGRSFPAIRLLIILLFIMFECLLLFKTTKLEKENKNLSGFSFFFQVHSLLWWVWEERCVDRDFENQVLGLGCKA